MLRLPRPTPRTLGVSALGAALFMVAWGTGQQDLVWPALFLLALASLTLLVALTFRPAYAATRTVRPDVIAVGDTADVTLTLGTDRIGVAGSTIAVDDPGPGLGSPHSFEVDATRRNVARYQVRARHRGRQTLDQLTLRTGDALGFWAFTRRLSHPTTLIVTPRMHPLPPGQVPAYGEVGETPMPRTSFMGPDDATVREYASGDDVRRIHWRSTARTGEIMVRREEAAWDPAAWIVLDSRGWVHPEVRGEHPGFEWLVSAAASIGVRLLADGFDVSLVDASGHAHHCEGRSGAAAARFLDPLVDADVDDRPALDAAVTVIERAPEDRVVIALLGRLDAATCDLLAGLDGSRHARIALVLDADADARDRLASRGWDVRETTADGDLAQVWWAAGARAAR